MGRGPGFGGPKVARAPFGGQDRVIDSDWPQGPAQPGARAAPRGRASHVTVTVPATEES
jgi:hypothetical protein